MTKVTRFSMDDSAAGEKRRLHLREISGESDAPLGTVGQDLRAARLRLGDDLATVSNVLKIRKDHLEALEEDRLEALPGRTYAVGFVRSYATYLGLDAGEYLERFKQEIAGRAEGAHLTPYIDPGDRRLPQGWPVIAVAFAALLIFGIYLLVKAAGSDTSPPVGPVPAEIANAARPAPAPVAPAPLAPASQATAPAPAAPPAAETPAPVQAAPAAPAPAALPKGQELGLQNTGSRVELQANHQVYVSVKGPDGTVYIGRMLQPGDTYRVPNLPGLILNATDGSAVNVIVDGKPMGPVGSRARPADNVLLDPQAIAERHGSTPVE
jgi:cytoskeleton protein RodZ